MARVVLLTGGNVGDVKERLRSAQRLINSRIGAVLRCSHCYESAPWGFETAQPFINQVLVSETDLAPHEVLAEVLRIERELGRNRAAEAAEKPARERANVAAIKEKAEKAISEAQRLREMLLAMGIDPDKTDN